MVESHSRTPSFLVPLRALRHRNYRLFFFGQSISLIGTWMQRVAVGWLVYRLTGSEALLGLEAFLTMFPSLFMSPIGGVLADRYDRRRLLYFTQILSAVQALLLAIIVLSGFASVWQVIVLSAFLGLVHSMDIPIRQSMIVQVVDDRQDLGNAIALNSILFNGAMFVGPPIAGLIIFYLGEGSCFLINALSFCASLIALSRMRIAPLDRAKLEKSFFLALVEGWQYAVRTSRIRSTLLLLALMSFSGRLYLVLLPVFAAEIIGGGARQLGIMNGAVGLGALVGAFCMAFMVTTKVLERIIMLSSFLLSAAVISFAWTTHLPLALIFLFAVGVSELMMKVSCNTLLQSLVTEEMRGRIMSLYTMAFRGTAPLGYIIGGILASYIGAPTTMMLSGVFCLLSAVWFLVSRNSTFTR